MTESVMGVGSDDLSDITRVYHQSADSTPDL